MNPENKVIHARERFTSQKAVFRIEIKTVSFSLVARVFYAWISRRPFRLEITEKL